MLSCQTPEGRVREATGEEDINSGCHRGRTGLAQFQLRRVFVDTAQPHETNHRCSQNGVNPKGLG